MVEKGLGRESDEVIVGNLNVAWVKAEGLKRFIVQITIIKQWKKPKTIYPNLMYLNRKYRNEFNEESIYKVANSRLGWYKRCGMNIVNYILSPELLETKVKGGANLLNPLQYYLRNVGI